MMTGSDKNAHKHANLKQDSHLRRQGPLGLRNSGL